jgi:aspartate/methionine/tyrosine aminotransferase
VEERVATLQASHDAVRGALERALGPANVFGGSGALYLFARLTARPRTSLIPGGGAEVGAAAQGGAPLLAHDALADDEDVVERLAKDFGVALIPGSSCGSPGFVRVGFANLSLDATAEASRRLEAGLKAILG